MTRHAPTYPAIGDVIYLREIGRRKANRCHGVVTDIQFVYSDFMVKIVARADNSSWELGEIVRVGVDYDWLWCDQRKEVDEVVALSGQVCAMQRKNHHLDREIANRVGNCANTVTIDATSTINLTTKENTVFNVYAHTVRTQEGWLPMVMMKANSDYENPANDEIVWQGEPVSEPETDDTGKVIKTVDKVARSTAEEYIKNSVRWLYSEDSPTDEPSN